MPEDKGERYKKITLLGREVNLQYLIATRTDQLIQALLNLIDITQIEILQNLNDRNQILLDELNGLSFGLQNSLIESITDGTVILGTEAYKGYNDILSFDGKLNETIGFNNVLPSADQLREATKTIPLEGHILSEWIHDSFDKTLVKDLTDEFGKGIIRGESLRKLAKRVPAALELNKRAVTTLTRTYIAHVNNQAAEEVYKANSDIIKYVEWNATLEVAMSGGGTCIQCALLDSRKYKLNEPHPTPPIHMK